MDFRRRGKPAIVSRSTNGICLAIATGLAREGTGVIANGSTDDSLNEALTRIRQAAQDAILEGFAGDLTSLRPRPLHCPSGTTMFFHAKPSGKEPESRIAFAEEYCGTDGRLKPPACGP